MAVEEEPQSVLSALLEVLPHSAFVPHTAPLPHKTFPRIADTVPHTALVPHTAESDCIAFVPHTALLPQSTLPREPQITFELVSPAKLRVTAPVLGSKIAVGDGAGELTFSVLESAVAIFR